jgi:3-(3-hydroxy-phenyl)propionate hydroxylase
VEIQPTFPNFKNVEYPVHVPTLLNGREQARLKVLIAGGGPVGLAMSLALARHGVASVLVEADRGVCGGSRAICLSRRTLEILDRLGVLEAFQEKGLPWTSGRSFYRRDQVLQFRMPHDDDQRLAPMTNLQQYYTEQFLLNEALRHPELIGSRRSRAIIMESPAEARACGSSLTSFVPAPPRT